MFGKAGKMEAKCRAMLNRIEYLEALVCGDKHSWITIKTEYTYNGVDADALHIQVCTKCGKRRETMFP